MSRLLDPGLTLTTLRMALSNHTPEVHHSDQGVLCAAYAYIDLLKTLRTQIRMAVARKAEENGYAERFMRTIKDEEVDLTEYLDFVDALSQITYFVEEVYIQYQTHPFFAGIAHTGRV
jgi:putative transposase